MTKYMLFAGREVRIEKKCTRGLVVEKKKHNCKIKLQAFWFQATCKLQHFLKEHTMVSWV